RLEQIHRWVDRARLMGIVPIPLRSKDGATALEFDRRLWEVLPWMPGSPDLSDQPIAERVAAAFVGLAEFHLAMGEIRRSEIAPGLIVRLNELELLQARRLDECRAILAHQPRSPTVEEAKKWLALANTITQKILPRIRLA